MTRGLILALRGSQEAELLDACRRSSEVAVARRLTEINEVVAAISAGAGSVAVVDVASAVDRSAISTIRRNAGICIVICPMAQVGHWESLGALAIDADLPVPQILELIEALSRDGSQQAPTAERTPISEELPLGQIIMVTGPMRTGRSLIALNLANELAQGDNSVALVDADVWNPSMALMLGLAPERHGIATLMRRHQERDLTVEQVQNLGHPVSDQLLAITGISAPAQWREVTEDGLRGLCHLLRRHFHHVVVDAPTYLAGEVMSEWDPGPARNGAFQTLISHADQLVVVGNPDVIGISRMVTFLQNLPDLTALPPVIVMNRMRSSAAGIRTRHAVSEILHDFGGVEEAHFIPEDAKSADRSLLRAVSLRDLRGEGALLEALASLAQELGAPPPPQPRRNFRWLPRRPERA